MSFLRILCISIFFLTFYKVGNTSTDISSYQKYALNNLKENEVFDIKRYIFSLFDYNIIREIEKGLAEKFSYNVDNLKKEKLTSKNLYKSYFSAPNHKAFAACVNDNYYIKFNNDAIVTSEANYGVWFAGNTITNTKKAALKICNQTKKIYNCECKIIAANDTYLFSNRDIKKIIKYNSQLFKKFENINYIYQKSSKSNLPSCPAKPPFNNCYGSFSWKNGTKYIGEWKNNKRHGKGLTNVFTGNKYRGEYQNDKRNGFGTYTWVSGSRYVGHYKNDKRHGFGTYTWKNGDKFVGEYKNGKRTGEGKFFYNNGSVKEGVWKDGKFLYSKKINANNDNFIKKPALSSAELNREKQKRIRLQRKVDEEERKRKALEKEIVALKQKNKELQETKKQQKPSNETGSGFYVSKFRHIVTNQHVVNKCKKITVGDSMSTQIPANLIASDKRNDLAILQTVSMEMASADTKSFVRKLAIEIVPVLSGGLMRSEDVVGGEEIFVAGFPLANQISDSLKLSDGIVSSTKGYENDVSKFEITSVVRKGNSGGPIYDKKGNIVGVVVEQVNVSRSDNVNFAIKGSTVKQFLSAHNVPTKWSNRQDKIDTKDIYKIASKQTVMVMCHR